MIENDFHALITESVPPFTIATKGGRSYLITDSKCVWAPEDSPDMICVVPKGRGIIVLRINSIESVQLEHEASDYAGTVRHWTENR